MKIAITITGISPLICNKFSDAAAEKATNGTSGSSANADRGTPQEICESKLYVGLDGDLMIPQPNLLRCIVDGGQFHKIGKRQVSTAKSSLVYGCLDIAGAEIPLQYNQPWTIDVRAVRIPSTGGRILAYRPMFLDWSLSFEADLDVSIIGPKLFRQIVDDAGKRIGLGDFRPATKGPFGRFCVDRWDVIEEKLAA